MEICFRENLCMRIALCLSGQPRSFEKAFVYVNENLLSKFNVDVFLHTWYYGFFDYTKLINLYQPKKIQIDQYMNVDLPKNFRYCPYNVYCAKYSIHKSCLLMSEYESENNFIYDWGIRSRYDFALNMVPDFFNYDSEKIYTPPSLHSLVCNDQFAIGSSENIKKYSSAFLNIPFFMERGDPVVGEGVITENLKLHNLWDTIQYLNMNDPFYPDQYGCMRHSLIREDFDFWSER